MLRDDDKAWTATFKDDESNHLPAVQTVGYDILAARSWMYMSHGGVYTPPSRVSSGYCSWIQVLSGCQIIGLISQKMAADKSSMEEMSSALMSRADHIKFFSNIDSQTLLPDSDEYHYKHTFLHGNKVL